jgi:hypothetical protein
MVTVAFAQARSRKASDDAGGDGKKSAGSPAATAHDGGTVRSGPGSGSGRGYGPGLGGKGRTRMFGVEAEGFKFVYVLDRSASMGGSGPTALRAAKAELLASLQDLDQTHQFQIVFYNEKPTVFNPTGDSRRALYATERNKALAARFVESMTAFDGTQHQDALLLALKMRPDVIFWLTDADEPKLGPGQLDRINRMAAGTVIHAIEFGSGPQTEADNFLVKVARQSGGKHAYVDVTKLPEGNAR